MEGRLSHLKKSAVLNFQDLPIPNKIKTTACTYISILKTSLIQKQQPFIFLNFILIFLRAAFERSNYRYTHVYHLINIHIKLVNPIVHSNEYIICYFNLFFTKSLVFSGAVNRKEHVALTPENTRNKKLVTPNNAPWHVFVCPETNEKLHLKLKLPVLVGPLSAIQPFSHLLTCNLPWSLGYIRKLEFVSPWENYFTPGFMCSQHMAPRNI